VGMGRKTYGDEMGMETDVMGMVWGQGQMGRGRVWWGWGEDGEKLVGMGWVWGEKCMGMRWGWRRM